ncbi:MAG: DUF5050 domain-containing protein [Bacillota bacterium]|nr:DUF5050 domain-containing protein [Bacillota bacterium]
MKRVIVFALLVLLVTITGCHGDKNEKVNPNENNSKIELSNSVDNQVGKVHTSEYTADDELSLTMGKCIVKYDNIVVFTMPSIGRIFKCDLLKKTTTKLSDDSPEKLVFDGTSVYYALNGEKTGIYRLGLDGSSEKISDDYSLQIAINNNIIYYTKQIGFDQINGTPQGELHRMDLDGNNNSKLLTSSVKHFFGIKGEWIYFTRLDNRSLNKARLDGSQETLLAKGRTYIQYVSDKNIYYSDYNDREALHKLNLDNGENILIGRWGLVRECDGNVYIQVRLCDKQGIEDDLFSLVLIDEEKDEQKKQFIMADTGIDRFFEVKDDWVYLNTSPKGAYRININDGREKEMFAPDYIIAVYGEYAYCFDESMDMSDDYIFDRIKLGSAGGMKNAAEALYGGIQTAFAGFRITPDKISYLVKFEEDGKVGFKDGNGKIIVEAIYGKAGDFHKGIARVRIDKEDEYIWKCIDINGKVYNYDEVYGFEFGLSAVLKDAKYGFINTSGELVVPLIYDELYCAYTDNARSTYAVRDGDFVYLNLTNGYEESYERYDINKVPEYARTIDLRDYNIVVVNDMLVVNGAAQPCALDLPISILQDLDFDLYTQSEKLGTYKAKLTPGCYEGEIFVSFPDCPKYSRPQSNKNYEEYYAVLNSSNIKHREVSKLAKAEKYSNTAKQYLRDNYIENTPFSIDNAYKGDFSGNGVTGAVFEVNDTYRKDDIPRPFEEKWPEKKFVDNKTAFVNTILYIRDIKNPLEYRIVKSNIWNHIDWDYKTENIGFIANLDADNQFELLVSNGYYEYRDYAIVDFE